MKRMLLSTMFGTIFSCAFFVSRVLAGDPCFITLPAGQGSGAAAVAIGSMPAEATETILLSDKDCDGLPDSACLECTPAYDADNCRKNPNGPDLGTCTAGLAEYHWGKRAALMLSADRAALAAWRRRMPTLTVMAMPAITAAAAGFMIWTVTACATGMIIVPQPRILCRRMPTATVMVMHAAGQLTGRRRSHPSAAPGMRSAGRSVVSMQTILYSSASFSR